MISNDEGPDRFKKNSNSRRTQSLDKHNSITFMQKTPCLLHESQIKILIIKHLPLLIE